MAISTAPDSSWNEYESVVPETPSRIRYAAARRPVNETTTPEFASIPPRLQPVVCFSEGECDRFAKSKEYSDLWIFFTDLLQPGKVA